MVGRDRVNVDFLVSETLLGVAEWDLLPAVKSYDGTIPLGGLCMSCMCITVMSISFHS